METERRTHRKWGQELTHLADCGVDFGSKSMFYTSSLYRPDDIGIINSNLAF